MNISGLSVVILVFVLIGYFVGRISSKKIFLSISLSIGVISIVVLYFLVGLSYFDVPSHTFTIEDYFEVIKGTLLIFSSVLAGGALGSYFKNKTKALLGEYQNPGRITLLGKREDLNGGRVLSSGKFSSGE